VTTRSIETVLLVGLGGFAGANLRYWVAGWAAQRLGQSFPWGTLIINVSGSLLLAVFLGWSLQHIGMDPRMRLLVIFGFFGAYTTFSTYANESVLMLETGDWLGVLGNVVGMNLLCLAGALVGLAIGRQL
jgi:fluoride exporter